ncbi:zinc metallopeptidase [Streptococcus pneumoniae]|nr:zinc metallopeptidase [Streptococcus pneumoniae]
MDLSNKASNLRKKLGADGESPIDIFKLVQKIENFYGLGKNISGVCYKGTQFSLIAVNSEMPLGR